MADQNVPDWLTAEFLKSTLESDQDNFPRVTIIDYTAESAVAAGNNYGSHMLRVKIYYSVPGKDSTKQSISLIVKAPITTGGFVETFEGFSDIYDKEPKYYNEFIKETYELCKHDLVPKHYPSPFARCVVMEDLKSSGYEMVARTELLDIEHSHLYIKASAKLQALSIAVHNRNPEMILSLVKESPKLVESMDAVNKGMTIKGLICVIAFLEDKPAYKEYATLSRNLLKNDKLWTLCKEAEKYPWPLKSLAQLDPWCTNMMFKYNSDRKVVGVKLLDFQTTKFTTPVYEFISFILMSVHPDLLKSELDNFYNLYCDSLNDNLAALECPQRLHLDQLKSEILQLSPAVFSVVCLTLPFILFNDVPEINDYLVGEVTSENVKESRMFRMYENPILEKLYPKVFDLLTEIGVLGYLKEKSTEV